jgi:hypothetical protein
VVADACDQGARRSGIRLGAILPDADLFLADIEPTEVEVGDTSFRRRTNFQLANFLPAYRRIAVGLETI